MALGKGIPLINGFDLNSKQPLDNRAVADTTADMNALITGNSVADGQLCYCKEDKKLYVLKDSTWTEVGGSGGIPVVEGTVDEETSEDVITITIPEEQTEPFILHIDDFGYLLINVAEGSYFCLISSVTNNVAYQFFGSGTSINFATLQGIYVNTFAKQLKDIPTSDNFNVDVDLGISYDELLSYSRILLSFNSYIIYFYPSMYTEIDSSGVMTYLTVVTGKANGIPYIESDYLSIAEGSTGKAQLIRETIPVSSSSSVKTISVSKIPDTNTPQVEIDLSSLTDEDTIVILDDGNSKLCLQRNLDNLFSADMILKLNNQLLILSYATTADTNASTGKTTWTLIYSEAIMNTNISISFLDD